MHIFLVNDDGIGAVGIMALLKAAAARGHRVTMCAPASQQSAASQRITLSDPIFVKEYAVEEENAKAYAVSGTPADCVRVGLLGGLAEGPVDLLLSGVNNGYNAGMAVHYSGTVGAATEGALNGVPSIAASIDYNATPEHLADFARYIIGVGETYVKTAPSNCQILNVNCPNLPRSAWGEPVYAPLSQSSFSDGYVRGFTRRAGVHFWLEDGAKTQPFADDTDQWYLERGCPVFTLLGNPLCAPKADFDALHID